MKKTVRILSALLAVMMICMTFAVTAGAEEVNTLKLSSDKTGFKFSIFKLADLNETTGAFTINESIAKTQRDEVEAKLAVVDATNAKAKAIATYLDGQISGKSVADQLAILGTPVATFDTKVSATMEITTLVDGIYYVTALAGDTPANVTQNQGSIFVLPEYNPTSNTWNYTVDVKLGGKVSSGEVEVDKTIVPSKDYTTSANNDSAITDETTPVKFQLSASIVGSKEQPLKAYVIGDKMDDGLTYVAGQTPVVKLVDGTNEYALTAGQYEVKTAPKYTGAEHQDYTFAVELDADVFGKDKTLSNGKSFYDYKKVVVEYVATINENIEVIKAEDNKDYLLYQNNGGSFTEVIGDTVKVYTLGIDVTKYDATTNDKKKLAGAEFTLYAKDADGKLTAVAMATSTIAGFDKFYASENDKRNENEYNVKPGNYVIKETKAPDGYTLNTAEIPVVVAADLTSSSIKPIDVEHTEDVDGYFSRECGNTPIILPATGGAGTVMFTIVGAILISLAGVLFYAVMRKKDTSK